MDRDIFTKILSVLKDLTVFTCLQPMVFSLFFFFNQPGSNTISCIMNVSEVKTLLTGLLSFLTMP